MRTVGAGSGVRERARWGLRQLRERRFTWAEIRRLAVTLVLSWLTLAFTIGIMPGVSAGVTGDVLAATVLLGVLGALLRPLLTSFALLLGWIGVLLAGFGVQALLFYLALTLAPGIHVNGFWDAFWASWVFAFLMSIVTWIATAGDSSAFLTHLVQRSGHDPGTHTTTVPGVVFLQIDGLPAPLLRWGIRSGDLPTLSRWIRSGTHRLTDWHAQLPATTPASQAGLLHGRSDQVPAFRWYEKETGTLLVANHPKDAAVIQHRLSDGSGLLADAGVSISNIFSGDAPTSLLTMSGLANRSTRRGPSRSFATFFINPYGLTRSIVLTAAEMIKEVHQARLQRVRGVEPRIRRHGSYILLRGVTNVLLQGPQRRAHRRPDDGRHTLDLLRLHRLRRNRPPCRADPPGILGLAGRHRPAHRRPRDLRRAGAPPLPVRRPLRPRAEPGRHLPAAVRHAAAGTRPATDGLRVGRRLDRARRDRRPGQHVPHPARPAGRRDRKARRARGPRPSRRRPGAGPDRPGLRSRPDRLGQPLDDLLHARGRTAGRWRTSSGSTRGWSAR